jgi:antitoxin ParD1/3/4
MRHPILQGPNRESGVDGTVTISPQARLSATLCPLLANRHKLSYYEAMPMTSLNISLPEALKEYVEGQVASGDWGTPSEYVRELIRHDKERRLGDLEQELVAAAKGPKIEIPLAEIRRKGLISALRARARRR